MSKIIDAITALALPIVEQNGCELWEIEYVKEPAGWVLRVYIDRVDGGVMIDHCEAISRELDPILDENEDIIPGSYTFEVSSAGAERRLKRPSDFERFMGHLVEVKLYKAQDGRKIYLGNLTSYSKEDGIEIDVSGQKLIFPLADVSNIRLRISN
ncbi:MAG: ribosome maturation factor RimP [Oscillospiraceae bacterium]|nr:ribosome maturation factor RimP [Oscillospiraceae bacterium]